MDIRKNKNIFPHVAAIQLSDIKGKQAVMDSFASSEFMLMTGGVSPLSWACLFIALVASWKTLALGSLKPPNPAVVFGFIFLYLTWRSRKTDKVDPISSV